MPTVAGPVGKFLISYLPSLMPLVTTAWPPSLTKVIVPFLSGLPVPTTLTVPVMFPWPWQPTIASSAATTNQRSRHPPHRTHGQAGTAFIVLLAQRYETSPAESAGTPERPRVPLVVTRKR